MKYTKLGNSDLNVSRICMGCMGFGDAGRGQQHIENMINTSLQNLGMDYVDLYIYHMWDWQTPIEDIMDGLNRIVKAGKARYIGISNCFAWQIAKANALASGRLSRLPGEGGTKRAEEDTYAKFKYDATAAQDNVIISRAAEIAEKPGVTMTEVSLAWLLTKVTSPVVGATKLHHIEGAAKAVDLELGSDEKAYLEKPYVPHPLAGVMAQNKPAAAKEKHVWSTGDQKIGK